jgi:hypothetical protein
MKRAIALIGLAAILSGCASLAVRPCDSVADRDSKYAARFFLGVLTLGISEAAIHNEQWLEAREGWRFCPPPVGWQGPPPPGAWQGPPSPSAWQGPPPPGAWQGPPPPGAWQGPPSPTAAVPRTPGLLINTTRWTVNVYLDTDPATSGVLPFLTLRPGEGRQLAFLAGPHRIVANPVAEASGAPAPTVRYERQIQIEPRDRNFRLQLSEGEFR